MDFADPAGVVVQDAVGHRDDVFGGGGVHAVVAGFEFGEFLGAFLDEGVGAEQHVRAMRGGRLAPDTGFEGFACPGHCRIDGRLVGIGDFGDLLLGGRIENRNDPQAPGVDHRIDVDGVTQCPCPFGPRRERVDLTCANSPRVRGPSFAVRMNFPRGGYARNHPVSRFSGVDLYGRVVLEVFPIAVEAVTKSARAHARCEGWAVLNSGSCPEELQEAREHVEGVQEGRCGDKR